MSFAGKLSLYTLTAALLVAGNGCAPDDSSTANEEKEPHYVQGNSRVNAMDYTGAVEAFTEALEVNPHSAAAHFQLACLFDSKASDPAAAIFHYQEFLRLNPKADNAETIRMRIYSCKQQLAADVLPLPSAPAAQKQLEDLAEKNRQLGEKSRQLQDEVEKWRVYYAALQASGATNPPAGPTTSLAPDDVTTPQPATPDHSPSRSATAVKPAVIRPVAVIPAIIKPVRAHTHVVAAGETLASIARKHGVSLTALQAANPGVSPKKMRVGQTLNLPQ
jgi:tetratricopeptide (TPR) repeat protein